MASTRKSLTGKICLITGGGSGLGRAFCQALASEGATIVIFDINKHGMDETIASLPEGDHKGYLCDVTLSNNISESFQQVKNTIGIPTIVILAAGIAKASPFIDLKEQEFDAVFAVHVKGTFLMMQAAAQALIDNDIKDGRIITISSVAKRGFPFIPHYSAAKAAIVALTRSAAKEWAHIPIRCISIAPGIFRTPMTEIDPEGSKPFIAKTALQRYGEPEELAELITFIATQKSSFMTGATIPFDGCFDG